MIYAFILGVVVGLLLRMQWREVVIDEHGVTIIYSRRMESYRRSVVETIQIERIDTMRVRLVITLVNHKLPSLYVCGAVKDTNKVFDILSMNYHVQSVS